MYAPYYNSCITKKSSAIHVSFFFLPVERDISSRFLCSFQNRSLRLEVILQPCEPWINDIRKNQLGLHKHEVIIFKSSNFRLTALHKYFQDSFYAWSPNSFPLFSRMISVSASENSWFQRKVFLPFSLSLAITFGPLNKRYDRGQQYNATKLVKGGWGGGASVKRLLFLSLIRDTFVWIITGRSLKCFSRLNSNKGNNLGLYWRAVEQR